MNDKLAQEVIKAAIECGVEEFCFCPGARNAPLVSCLIKTIEAYDLKLKGYSWFEERSAAFFALGKSRASGRPVAVLTTSGSAVAELLPAAMEAHYSGVPLLLISADRPRHFRGTGAPQCAEQVGLFGCYVEYNEDLSSGETSKLYEWKQRAPAHLNVCFDEPLNISYSPLPTFPKAIVKAIVEPDFAEKEATLTHFLEKSRNLFVVVSTLKAEDRPAVTNFLLHLNAPVYLEGISGLREEDRLKSIRITDISNLFESAKEAGYPIDSVLRIGGIPTFRPWRDLDVLDAVKVCSLSELPFTGLAASTLIQCPLKAFLQAIKPPKGRDRKLQISWFEDDILRYKDLQERLELEPDAEASLIHTLSKTIPEGSLIYLGNSLPIRYWDLAATHNQRRHSFHASRGINGIDGQLSTFLGLCEPDRENIALLGDLTTLYDMAAMWILTTMKHISITFIVINNSGGQIFARMFPEKAFINEHELTFRPLAGMWGMHYEKSDSAFEYKPSSTPRHTLVELIPDARATARFQAKKSAKDLKVIKETNVACSAV